MTRVRVAASFHEGEELSGSETRAEGCERKATEHSAELEIEIESEKGSAPELLALALAALDERLPENCLERRQEGGGA